MRLLICTQTVDLNDPVLGFFHGWIAAFSRHCESVHVICLKEGRHSLPANVFVHSLGKHPIQGLPLESKGSPWKFTRPMMHDGTYYFSFSGLKTAVRRIVEANSPLSDEMKMRISREFEDTVTDVLIAKTLRAADEYGAQTLVVGGGVSANTFIRSELARRIKESGTGLQLLVPPPELATDNAIMIALAGYFRAFNKEFFEPEALVARGNLRLED